MIKRVLASSGLAGVIATLATLPVAGQTQSGPAAQAPPLVITAFNGGSGLANWTPPKTPWGEPDLQGVWSSDDATFPVSRPANQSDLYLNDEQWAARQKQIQQGITTAENAIGAFRGDFARRAFRQTSYIVDPP